MAFSLMLFMLVGFFVSGVLGWFFFCLVGGFGFLFWGFFVLGFFFFFSPLTLASCWLLVVFNLAPLV